MNLINCNHLNHLLTDEELLRINKQCKLQNHISDEDNLQNIIKKDEQIVRDQGITFEQLKDFFQKIKLHFNDTISKHGKVELNKKQEEHINKYSYIGGPGWSLWEHQVGNIFHDQITVCKITWGGAELCPFQSLEDERYHGYEYGSHDWIFINNSTNTSMHIGDLLFHQIAEHHFFQRPSSKYYVSPLDLICFFSIKPEKSYKSETTQSYIWNFSSGQFGNKEQHYTIKDFYGIENLDLESMKYEKHGKNEFYYQDDSCYAVINEVFDQPIDINGIQFIFQYHGAGKYRKDKLIKITDQEIRQHWIIKKM